MKHAVVLDEQTRFRPAPNVHARELGEEVVLLDFAGGEYFSLDHVGATIWGAMTRAASLGEMADLLVQRYDVSREEAVRDALALMRTLLERALVVTTGSLTLEAEII